MELSKDAISRIYTRMRWIRSVCDLPESARFGARTGDLFGSEAALSVLGAHMSQGDLVCAGAWHPALALGFGAAPRQVLETVMDGPPPLIPRRADLRALVERDAGEDAPALLASHDETVSLGHMVGLALAHRSGAGAGVAVLYVSAASVRDGSLWDAFAAAVDLRLPILFVTVTGAPSPQGLAPADRLAGSAGVLAASARDHDLSALHKACAGLVARLRGEAGPALLDLIALGQDPLLAIREMDLGTVPVPAGASLDAVDRSVADALDHMLGRYRGGMSPGAPRAGGVQ